MKHVLLIEDDLLIHKLLKNSLTPEFGFLSAYTAAEANQLLDTREDIALVLVDRQLPDGDGLSICTRIRKENRLNSIPVIFLTSAETESDKVTGFFAGADDYVTKPFSVLELKARILARFRTATKTLVAGRLTIDLDAFRVFMAEQGRQREISLTRTEFKMLVALAQSLDRVFSREALLSKVWGDGCHVSDRVVDTHMSHLRKKISGSTLVLESLRGEGYRLSIQATARQAA